MGNHGGALKHRSDRRGPVMHVLKVILPLLAAFLTGNLSSERQFKGYCRYLGTKVLGVPKSSVLAHRKWYPGKCWTVK